MKTVLLIIPELGGGGAERSLSKISMELANTYNVLVCPFFLNDKQIYPVGGELISLNLPPAKGLGKLSSWRQRVKALKRIKETHRVDVTISFLEGANYLNVLTRGYGKTVISIRGSKTNDGEIRGFSGWIRKRFLIPILFRKADRVVCVSQKLMVEMREVFKIDDKRLLTITNFYDLQGILKAASEPLTDMEKSFFSLPVVINVGRMHQQKEQLALIRCFKEVKSRINARLLIIGEGALKSACAELCRELNLSVSYSIDDPADVCLAGYSKNPFKYLKSSSVFALSSSWEGFPNALAEAMICGVPCLSSDCETGPRELMDVPLNKGISYPFNTDYGTLLPVFLNQEAEATPYWVESISGFLTEDKKSVGTTAQRRMEIFETRNVINQWKELIDQP